ncbi:MAG: SIMPL domain-containing protein [Anaerolineales bacterium]|nr:SIMPL domain-containing protein [Anaerolineales bacterium]
MKQIFPIINAILAAGLVILLFYACLPILGAQAAQFNPAPQTTPSQPGCDSSRSVQISGSAMINVTPDRAQIQLGVQSNGLTPDAVQSANSTAIQKVINALKSQGIEAKDIATDVYLIDPVYENYDSLYIKGYRINNIIAVTLRDVKKTSTILAVALGAGANQVINVDFYTSELRKYRDQARELAVKAAHEKAQALATAAGTEMGCVLTINENTSFYYNGWWYGASQNQWTQNTVQNVAPSGNAPTGSEAEPISLGQISIKAEVGVTYGLK